MEDKTVTLTVTNINGRYNVSTKTFTVVVPASAAGGPLELPVYLTFGKTDPARLEYRY